MVIGTMAGSMLLFAQPAAAQFTRVSVATDGSQADGPSLTGVLSADGKFVAFSSLATNLVANDTNAQQDVFVRDLTGNATTRVSVTSTGGQALASSAVADISDDGTIVLFTSFAALDGNDAKLCTGPYGAENCQDVYVHNRTSGQTTRVSVATGGALANNYSANPEMSGDGRYIVFESVATNLVTGDTNGKSDIFLHDLVTHTTTLISRGEQGEASTADAHHPSISEDGLSLAFITEGAAFGEAPDALPCDAVAPATCTRAFRRGRTTTALRRLTPLASGSLPVSVHDVKMGRTGGVTAVSTARNTGSQGVTLTTELFDSSTGLTAQTSMAAYSGLAIGGNNRLVANGGGDFSQSTRNSLELFDRPTGLTESIPASPVNAASALRGPSFDGTGRYLVFASLESAIVAGDTNSAEDIFIYDRDRDGDGIPSFWETYFGLDPANAADATADTDGDGRTNLEEYAASSHPNAAHARYFAEGAANSFFATRFAVVNPNTDPALVVLRFLGSNGVEISSTRTLAPNQRATFDLGPGARLPDAIFSTIVESNLPVVADRLMTWDGTGYGSTVETALAAPAQTWYLAEGATGAFSLYYLLQNPGDTEASVTVTYLRPAPAPPIVKSNYIVGPRSRFTIDVAGEDPGLLAAEVSAKIDSSVPIVVERAMYRTTNAQQPLTAGHAGAGLTTAQPRWFLAEGSTGFFDEYVLIANATNDDAEITATFLLEGNQSFQASFPVTKNTRETVDLKRYPQLAATPVSVVIESTNAVPVVVERVMWWPSGPTPYEASLSAGVTETGTKWAVAEGEQGGPFDSTTYVLVANTDPVRDAPIKVTLLFEDGTTIDVPNLDPVGANRRRTVDISTVAEAANRRFGVIIESLDGVPIVVERSFYSSSGGVLWNAGGTSVATNITPAVP